MRPLYAAALLVAPLLSACAGSAAAPSMLLTLPTARSSSALASTILYTSPDGGIYQNPVHVEVRMVVRRSPDDVARLLPGGAASWQQLRTLGDFTFIGVVMRNEGKAGSDPQLNNVQIASDFAPGGTSSGPLRHFYHPLFPLALLSQGGSDASCSLHVDPAQSAVAVLVYPPVRPAPSIVWGVYKSFALRVGFGGALPDATYTWHATACTPPQAPPAA